jgi:16S rRNA (adenine1518-N6/adenine1519-N6)-dimethyltransferase
MEDSSRQTRSQLMQLFAQQGLKPRHDLGQNFLVDLNLHDLIVRHAKLSTADVVLEIGTGTGGLTMRLAEAAGHVVSVEYDAHVFGHAQRMLGERSNVTLIHGDALANKNTLNPAVINAVHGALERIQIQETQGLQSLGFREDDNPWRLQPKEVTLKLVANLPYNVATPVMSNLVASDLPWSRMVVTIQWELAQRMLAKPGTSDYSALTVWLQSQSRLQIIRKLPPSVFWPPPKVDSAVLLVERDFEAQSQIVDRVFLHDLLRDVFTQRRKKLIGVLTNLFAEKRPRDGNPWASKEFALSRDQIEQLLCELNIPSGARAEQLPVATLVQLLNRLTPVSHLTPDA